MSTAEIQSKNGKHLYVIEFRHLDRHTRFYVLDLWGDTPFYEYVVINEDILYETSYGVWKYSFEYNNWHFCDCPGPCVWRLATIRESGRPHQNLTEDDMADSFAYAIHGLSLQTAGRLRQGVLTNITEEGGNEVSKYLFHVILFNTETEVIDFKGYIPAHDDKEALMVASQTYGKYNPNIHERNVKEIMHYEVKK